MIKIASTPRSIEFMSLHPRVPCQIEPRTCGWWLSFPDRPHAGLLLTSSREKCAFAQACGIDLAPEELPATWFFSRVSECPPLWYDLANSFSPPREPF